MSDLRSQDEIMGCALFTFWLEKNHQHIVNHVINILSKQTNLLL